MLGIGVYPMTWPIFEGARFRGVYHRIDKKVFLFEQVAHGAEIAPVREIDATSLEALEKVSSQKQ